MCYHNALTASAQALSNRFSAALVEPENYTPFFWENGFEHKPRPILTSDKPNLFLPIAWGLIPRWVENYEKALKHQNKTLNARSETIFETPSFRESILKRRCLIPSTGFYDSREVGKLTIPYRVFVQEEEIFSIAGVWDEWTDPQTGEVKLTYSMLTTAPNSKFSKIHNRMPMILPRSLESVWLDPDFKRKDQIEPLIQIYPEDKIDFYPIRKFKPGDQNNPDILKKVEYQELSQQELF